MMALRVLSRFEKEVHDEITDDDGKIWKWNPELKVYVAEGGYDYDD